MRQIVLDTETTGLYAKNGDRIVEIGCVELVDRKPTGRRLHKYLNPEREVAIETWHWLTIAAGLPHVELATQEAFVPQMLNMELLAVAGISFSKGCYPGQEIVARTQYLGKIKRRMVRVRLSASAKPGDQVFAPESGDQPCGALVFVARSPESTGDIEALLCAQIAAIEAGSITVGAPGGPPLTLLDLPYALDGPDTRKR